MSERYPGNHETHESKETVRTPESHESHLPTHETSKPTRHEKLENIHEIRSEIKENAQTTSEILEKRLPKPESAPPEQSFANRELKEMAYQRLLNRARRKLSPYERTMSRIIHQPVINAVSETVGRSVARPSGILGGGIVAFGGTLIYYLVAKHYGYNYNFLVFLFLISLGFIAGWTLEILWHLLRRKHKRKHT